MSSKKISSSSNSHIKQIVKIRKDKKTRKAEGKVLVVGKKAIQDAQKRRSIHTFITTKKRIGKKPKAKKILKVTKEVMKKITNVKSPEDVAALIEIGDEEIKDKNYVLILDNISDPGNLGTIIRSANALNFNLIIISNHSTDPYSEKALRAAKGATFFIPIKIFRENEIINFIKDNKLNAYLADIKGEDIDDVDFKKPMALIVSNESTGPSAWAKKIARRFTIPIKKDIDSLNAAIAGSIAMFEMRKS
ncbi:MAG: 23S rRNA (uridine(2479)-2'-O)-methyltransferase [Candidatus Anoxychlamydiales bacterium]|nr:23S rRNA (uridine(2479)-2'-O)-methyltransferase [Candidatus Anoxychlamydiales bacterium]